ncbi:LysR substrate-binding domain-containing protein [Frankia sp. QA3]|uniref:LysR substrate-binding domain-containing protein n=1 Tax=Frankia sp. QA3 TaxID=710111 RepID=UPI000269C638|nr:LysR substrate-binding domain-containing protein [Frankia sp. QA3]EIV94936.1 transcriptional regulator [Frankia sp. QA3]
MPELRQLRYFVAVAQERNLSRAAVRLHITQQSLSQQIRVLERQLGVTLFTRSARGVELTPTAAVLLREAQPLLVQAERAVEAVRRAARGEAQELRVGFLASVANYVMPPVVRAFHVAHPETSLRAEEVTIAAMVAGLRQGRLDAGLSRPPLVEDLVTEVILREPVAAVLPEGHPLAERATLTLAELADESWVLTPRSSWPPWHRKYDADFARAGYRPRVVQRGTGPQSLLALVAAGVGVTRLPLSARSLRDSGVAFVPLVDDEADVVLVWRADAASPALPLLREIVREVARTTDLTAGG